MRGEAPPLAPPRDLAADMGGEGTLDTAETEGPDRVPLYEYTWRHARFQAIKPTAARPT